MREKLQIVIEKMNKNKLNIFLFLYLLSIIILSRNTMISSCIIGFEKSVIISAIISIPIIIIFIRKLFKQGINKKNAILMSIFLLAIVITIILKRDWQLYNISILFYIFISVFFSSLLDFNKFKKYFINIMVFLAIYSIFTTYIVKPILIEKNIEEELISNGLIIYNNSEYKFLNLGFGFAYFLESQIRNYGIFTEPSYYQFYLIIAIVFLLFSNTKKTKKDYIKLVVLLITAFTTFSAAAIIIIGLIAVIQLVKIIVDNRRNTKKLIFILIGTIICIILLLQVEIVSETIESTYYKFTTENSSSNSRFGSIEFTIKKFAESPIIGKRIADILLYEKSLTNTTLTIASIYGVIGLGFGLYFTYKLSKTNRIWLTTLIFIIILLSYNSHLYIGVNSFWIILISNIKVIKENTNNESSLDS